MNLHGIHHVTAVSRHIGQNAYFYTHVLGLRLVKKSVNQDDVSAYHLFYADKIGSPGTDLTFFDFAYAASDKRGTDSITTTAFRVNGRDALDYWNGRLREYGVDHEGITQFAGYDVIRFDDPEGQRLMLVDDKGADYEGEIWDQTDVPVEHALRGFYAVMLSLPRAPEIDPILSGVLNMSLTRTTTTPEGNELLIYSMGEGGPGLEVWVISEPDAPRARLGAGGVHHVAYRVANSSEQSYWRQRVGGVGLPVSQQIDRFYFKSIYFRISNGILFEIATDGPGFDADEELESLGETLALPPFLEPRRAEIEANLKPIVMEAA